MGIPGFHKYCKLQLNNSYKTVNILDSLAEYKRQSGNDNPVIIIYVKSLVSHFQKDFKELLMGSRYNIHGKKFETFLKKLQDENVRMIFPVPISPPKEEKQQRNLNKTNSQHELIDKMEEYNKLEDLVAHYKKEDEFYQPFPFDGNLFQVLLEVAGKYGQILPIKQQHSSFSTCIRKVAEDEGAFAVLGFDSYYIITDLSWKYWCSNELDFDEMTTAEYDKEEVLKQLGITYDKVPLFIGLAFIGKCDETLGLIFGPRKFFFLNVAKFVKYTRFPIDYDYLLQRIEEKRLRWDKTKDTPLPDNFIEDLKIEVGRHVLPDNLMNECDSIGNYDSFSRSFTLQILLEGLIKFRLYCSDDRKSDLKQFPELGLPIIRKTAGILTKTLNSTVDSVYVGSQYQETRESHPEKFSVIEPTFDVPPFTSFISGNLTDHQKFSILMFLTDLKLDETQLELIPADNLLPIISMIFLIVNDSLKVREAVVILKSLLDDQLNNIPEDIEYPELVDSRLFRVTCLVSSFYHFFKKCLNSVGFGKEKFEIHLDGVHCQKIMASNSEDDVEFENQGDLLKHLLNNI